MLGCIMPMSSPMMKRMLGLAGACANDGKLNGGRLNAAKATLETSRLLPVRLLIFMTPDPPLQVLIGYWQSFRFCFSDRLTVAVDPGNGASRIRRIAPSIEIKIRSRHVGIATDPRRRNGVGPSWGIRVGIGGNTCRWRLLELRPVYSSRAVAKKEAVAHGSHFDGKCARLGAGADRAAHDRSQLAIREGVL